MTQPGAPQTTQPAPQPTYISFSAEINPSTTEVLLRACTDLANKKVQHVYFLFSTLGGNVVHGVTLYNVLRGLPFKVTMHNAGAVNSIGNVIFLAGDERYACTNSTFMFHGVGFDAVAGMRLEEKFLRERLDSISMDQRRIAAIIAERATFPDPAEIGQLFLEAVTKDPAYAKAKGIIHDIRDIQIPPGATILQLVFQR